MARVSVSAPGALEGLLRTASYLKVAIDIDEIAESTRLVDEVTFLDLRRLTGRSHSSEAWRLDGNSRLMGRKR